MLRSPSLYPAELWALLAAVPLLFDLPRRVFSPRETPQKHRFCRPWQGYPVKPNGNRVGGWTLFGRPGAEVVAGDSRRHLRVDGEDDQAAHLNIAQVVHRRAE